MLDIVALLFILLMAGLGIFLIYYMATLPGKIALSNDHPNARAVAVGGWATLLTGGVGWPFVLIWAYAVPKPIASDGAELAKLKSRVKSLEEQLTAPEGGAGK